MKKLNCNCNFFNFKPYAIWRKTFYYTFSYRTGIYGKFKCIKTGYIVSMKYILHEIDRIICDNFEESDLDIVLNYIMRNYKIQYALNRPLVSFIFNDCSEEFFFLYKQITKEELAAIKENYYNF